MKGFYVNELKDRANNSTCIKCAEGLNCDDFNFKFDQITARRGYYFNRIDTEVRGKEVAAVKCTPDTACLEGSTCAVGYSLSSVQVLQSRKHPKSHEMRAMWRPDMAFNCDTDVKYGERLKTLKEMFELSPKLEDGEWGSQS
jgi:hypothetical protein